MVTLVKCPQCGRPVPWSAESTYRPFCSDRCRLVDLGAWLTEEHRIPDDSLESSEMPSAPSSEDS